jgi:high-affinity iron transporter
MVIHSWLFCTETGVKHMGESFLITLREGLEIALVIAILAAYLVKSGRASMLRSMWIGVGAAAGVCIAAGVAFHLIVGNFTGKSEQFIEGALAASAASVLTWMIFWMRKNARGLSSELRAKLEGATTGNAVIVVAFVAVAREGFETVLFLLSAENGTSSAASVVIGGVLGLIISTILGILVYKRGQKLSLQTFFKVTGLLLIMLAAGLVGKAFHEFREFFGFETGRLIAPPAWNFTNGPLASGRIFDFLNGFFGWAADPEPIRVLTYFAYLVPVLWLFLKSPKPTLSAPGGATTTIPSPSGSSPSATKTPATSSR